MSRELKLHKAPALSQRPRPHSWRTACCRQRGVCPCRVKIYRMKPELRYVNGVEKRCRSTSGFGLTPKNKHFYRVSPCPLLRCLVDVRCRVRELSCSQSVGRSERMIDRQNDRTTITLFRRPWRNNKENVAQTYTYVKRL